MTRYEIRAGSHAPCELWSIVKTERKPLIAGLSWGGSDVENFVCEGTHTYCMEIKERLENG